MKVEIKVPSMGESITEATVGTILKETGSQVNMDDEVLELETDKVNQVLYAPQSGVVTWTVGVDDTVTIGQVIGTIDTDGAGETRKEEVGSKKDESETQKEEVSSGKNEGKSQVGNGEARVSKESYVQQMAAPKKEASTPKTVPAPTPEPKPQPVATGERHERRVRMSKIRKVIASRLVEAQQNTAMLSTFNEVDLTEVMELRNRYKESFEKNHGVKLGFMSFFVKAAVAALKEVQEINAYIDGDEIVYRDYYDIGIAVGTDRGLVVPVVRNCDQLSFAEIEQSIVDYATKAREGGLTVDDLQGGGFTITNGGVYGSLLSTPILNSPQSGILGMHKIEKRPVVINDEIVIRPMMYLAVSYDHRIVDGKEAVTFLVKIKEALEDPARLLLEV